MTVEKRTTIAPTDVLAVELECRECRHRIVRPSGLWQQEINSCPNCGTSWRSHRELLSRLQDAIFKLSGISLQELDQTNTPFRIRLEITGDGKP